MGREPAGASELAASLQGKGYRMRNGADLTRLEATPMLTQRRGHRAVGVVYHPEAEIGNYVPTVLPRRYDVILYLDTTQALHPLRDVPARSQAGVPETYPSGV